MKARMIEFNDNGKTVKTIWVDVDFASEGDPPCIEISLPDVKFRHRTIDIPVKGLLAMIMGRVIDRIRK